jgi:hypothetical protein
MMAGTKAIDDSHKEKGIEQTHTWDNTTKTCTPIVYSQPFTESDDVEQLGDEEEEEKGNSDDEPDDSTMGKMKRITLHGDNGNTFTQTPHNARENDACARCDRESGVMYDEDTRFDPRHDQQSIFDNGKIDENEKQHQGYRLQ